MTTGRRRTTLGVLSQSMANARMTPSRASFGGSKTPRSSIGSRGRASVGGRRSSVYGKGSSKVQEPRPIGEKAYTQENVRSLIQFLTSHQYDREVSPKILSTPARKDFVYILTFLFRHIDPNFDFPNNWADDVPVFFEAIGYPFRISKRSLLSVGSPHTWPSLLAALVWLADLITYIEEVEVQEQTGGLEDDNGEKVFYGYLANAYSKFLGGADNFSFLETDLAEQFKDKNKIVDDEVERFRSENEQLKAEIAELEGSKNTLRDLESKRKAFRTDIAKFEKLIADLEEYKDNIVRQREEKQTEFDALQSEHTALEREKEVMQTQMENQELSAVDVQRMAQEKSLLEKCGSKLSEEREALKKKRWDLDMACAKAIEKVEKTVHQYNQKAASVHLIPETAKYAHGVVYELSLNSQAATVEQMMSIDLKRVVKPSLVKLKESFVKSLRNQQTEKRRTCEQVAQTDEIKADKTDQVTRLQARLEKLENAYKEQREAMNKELMASFSSVEDLELELTRLQNSQSNALAASENELAQVTRQLEQMTTMCAEEQDKLRDEITSGMEDLAMHKVKIGKELKELDDIVETIKAEVA